MPWAVSKLSAVEAREENVRNLVAAGWLLTIAGTLLAVVLVSLL